MKLSSKTRKAAPTTVFALPKQRKFPIPDARHAANAKARATQGVHEGTLSQADAAQVKNKADKVLAKR